MKILELLRAQLAELTEKRNTALAQMDAAAEAAQAENRSALNTDEEAIFAAAEADVVRFDAEIEPLVERITSLEKLQERTERAQAGAAHRRPIVPGASTIGADDVRHMGHREIADAIVRSAESRDLDPSYARQILRRHSDLKDLEWARNLAFRATDVYESAWKKLVTGRELELTAEERTAMSVGTSANGGYLVPTHLDPTIMLTNSGSSNALRAISRVVTLSRENTWNGVTSAGVTASWDAELAEVSDDSPTVGTAQIPTYMARAFVQASAEAVDDIEGLASDILMLFGDARDRLEGAAHCTGTGSAQPTGIFTAITGSQMVTSTTAATIGLVDLQAVRRAVPVRFRGNSTWVYAPTYGDAIKALGTALSASYSTDITQGNTQTLLGRPVVESDDAPTTQTTTTKDPELILGDFRNFVIVDKPGSTSIEYIPHLFNTSNNLPDGRRGWFMRFRSGSDSVNDAAFRLLADKTSA